MMEIAEKMEKLCFFLLGRLAGTCFTGEQKSRKNECLLASFFLF